MLGNQTPGSHNLVLLLLIDFIIPNAKHYCNQDHNRVNSDHRVQHPAVHGLSDAESVHSTYKQYSL